MPFAVRGGHDFRETMNLEVGGGLIQEFEKRFGKTLTTIVLLLVMVAIVVNLPRGDLERCCWHLWHCEGCTAECDATRS